MEPPYPVLVQYEEDEVGHHPSVLDAHHLIFRPDALLLHEGDVAEDLVDRGQARDHRAEESAIVVPLAHGDVGRSEEHTSELQSQSNLVCRLLLEKKKKD